MVGAVIIALIIVAIVLGAIELSRTRLQSLLAWAVVALGAALIIGRLA